MKQNLKLIRLRLQAQNEMLNLILKQGPVIQTKVAAPHQRTLIYFKIFSQFAQLLKNQLL
jgi:hypothetical protein